MAEQKLFAAILDNGSGSVRASYMVAFLQAFGNRPNVFVQRFSDSLVSRNRNAASAVFLSSDCTDLIFIDADMIRRKPAPTTRALIDVGEKIQHAAPDFYVTALGWFLREQMSITSLNTTANSLCRSRGDRGDHYRPWLVSEGPVAKEAGDKGATSPVFLLHPLK
jgi:hypothetical protein